MENISDLQAGKAGEYLVCADLITKGHVAFPSEQGLPFDVIAVINNKVYRVQVKSTRSPRIIPQRKNPVHCYIFHIGHNGKRSRRKVYLKNTVEIFALVALDSKLIAYLPYFNTQTTMNFRVPSLRGNYHDEQGRKNKAEVLKMRKKDLDCRIISEKLGLKLSTVHRYSANVSIEQRGTNAGVYFDTFPIEKCMETLHRRG